MLCHRNVDDGDGILKGGADESTYQRLGTISTPMPSFARWTVLLGLVSVVPGNGGHSVAVQDAANLRPCAAVLPLMIL